MRAVINKIIGWKLKKIIGLDIDEGSVVATELAKIQDGVYLDRYALALSVNELIKDSSFNAKSVMINLPAQVVFFRSFHLALSFLNSKNKQRDITAFLSKQNLPFTLEECFWDTFVLNSNLNFIAARKDVVEEYIAGLSSQGLEVAGVTASVVALYNVLIHNYPERSKERFALLNIRNSSSELLVYEARRLWVYPLSIGKQELTDTRDPGGKFSLEVQRIFNAHYLQNPPQAAQKTTSYFYLSGQVCPEAVISSLAKVLGDFEITVLQPLKKIGALDGKAAANQQIMSLSLGLGLTYLEAPLTLKINLVAAKIKKAESIARINILKQASFFALIFLAFLFLLWNIKLTGSLKNQMSIYKNTSFQVSSVLPQIKALQKEKDKLGKLQGLLEDKFNQRELYLKALAAISESKPQSINIKELEVQIKDSGLQVFLSGGAPTYQEINDFLSGLKNNQDIKDVKVVASAFSAPETQTGRIDFKLHFEVARPLGQPESSGVLGPKDAQGKVISSVAGK